MPTYRLKIFIHYTVYIQTNNANKQQWSYAKRLCFPAAGVRDSQFSTRVSVYTWQPRLKIPGTPGNLLSCGRSFLFWSKGLMLGPILISETHIIGIFTQADGSDLWGSFQVLELEAQLWLTNPLDASASGCTVIWATRRLGDKSKSLNLGQPHRPGSCTQSLAVIIVSFYLCYVASFFHFRQDLVQ